MARRSRPPRAPKSRSSRPPEATQQEVAILMPVRDPVEQMTRHALDPSNTAQLAALEAGWDELLA